MRAVDRRRGLDEALDELYAAPLQEFIARRKPRGQRARGRRPG